VVVVVAFRFVRLHVLRCGCVFGEVGSWVGVCLERGAWEVVVGGGVVGPLVGWKHDWMERMRSEGVKEEESWSIWRRYETRDGQTLTVAQARDWQTRRRACLLMQMSLCNVCTGACVACREAE
jgi:hypothetical protein